MSLARAVTPDLRVDFAVDLGRAVACDVETYPGRWCVGFYGPGPDGAPVHRTVDRDPDELAGVLREQADRRRTLVTYNGDQFDVPVIRAILGGFDPYAVAQMLVDREPRERRPPASIARLPALGVDHVDLAARLRRGGHFPSLKSVAANLGRPTLRELPYEPGSTLDEAQWAEVRAYNRVDLEHTWAVLERYAAELQALATLSEELGRDLRSVPTPRVVETVFLDAYRTARGAAPVPPERPLEGIYRPVAGVRRPRTKAAAEWFDSVVETPIAMTPKGDPRDEKTRWVPDVPRRTFEVGGVTLKVGAGGLHSIDTPRVYYATRRDRLVAVDAASYYPSIIAAKGIGPRAYGEIGARKYREIVARRLKMKELARAEPDAAERARLEAEAAGLKLIVNSYFGKLGDRFSTLYDPGAMLAVTLTGQFLLIDLIERLTAAGARVLSVNTDGLFLRVARTDHRWHEALRQWQADTAMTLEVEPLRRLAILATNSYATLDRTGKVKRRGALLKDRFEPLQAPNSLVVADAVAAALLEDVPPERTIRGETDLRRFCRVVRRGANVAEGVLRDEDSGLETPLPKVTRFYKARESRLRIVHRFAGGRHTTPARAESIAPAQDIDPHAGGLPEDLDRNWYVREARRLVQAVPGYRHRSRRRLGDHPLAATVHARGLAPVPKEEKRQPVGSRAQAVTYLWDWDQVATVGTYTGPKVGILVVDNDDPKKFRAAVDKNRSPLLERRWEDFAGCLVSVRGEATAEDVRRGRARGKLIFRFRADADHPLARLQPNDWLKGRGIEVFYGRGLPSILGAAPDGDSYRLEGSLTDAPPWLVELLTPRSRPRGRERPHGAAGGPPDATPIEVDAETLEGLPKELATIAPELGQRSVGWHRKDLGDVRTISVGRCPFKHASGRSSADDLAAGYNQDGLPFVRCQHASCEGIPPIDERLKARPPRGRKAPATPEAEPAPAIEPTPLARSFLEDLRIKSGAALQVAPTGTGKSHSAAQVGAVYYREDRRLAIAVPTIRLASEITARLEAFIPEAFAADAVACIYGQHRDEPEGDEPDDPGRWDEDGQYPIHEHTRIVVCTHAQLGRRGFSRFIRGLWTKLAGDEAAGRPPFDILIDEAPELVREAQREIPLAFRSVRRRDPDRSGGSIVPLRDCPKSNRSGNCGNCTLQPYGGGPRFNRFGIRELAYPPVVEINAAGEPLRRPRSPLHVTLGASELEVGAKFRAGHTAYAAPVLAYQGRPVDVGTRRAAPLYLFRRNPDGTQPAESVDEVLDHMLQFAFRPQVTWEHPVDEAGEIIDPSALAARVEDGEEGWDAGIVFPHQTCDVPRLRFTDLAGLEQLRRHGAAHGAAILFLGASPSPTDREVLRTVWPELRERDHPYGDRRVRQIAVVLPEGHSGAGALVGPDGRLVTAALEAHGRGLVFCPTRKLATALYAAVYLHQGTARLAVENSEELTTRKTLHKEGSVGTYITYSRGVLGLGANLVGGVRHLVVDANAFRSITGFNPGAMTPEAFERMRAEDRLAVILQNLGRALRGEAGKTAVLFVLNADEDLRDALRDAESIRAGAELPPVFVPGKDLVGLVAQADRWLAQGGGNWPESGSTVGKRKGRSKGSTRKTAEDVLVAAEDALKAGMSWREFSRKQNVSRHLQQEQIDALKTRFGCRQKLPEAGENI